MSIGPLTGSNAYASIQKIVEDATSGNVSGSSSTSGTSGSNFADMVTAGAKDAMNTVRQSEAVSAQALVGNASLADVVTAVNGAEVALKSVVAIRDKVIAAYQDIIKMPI